MIAILIALQLMNLPPVGTNLCDAPGMYVQQSALSATEATYTFVNPPASTPRLQWDRESPSEYVLGWILYTAIDPTPSTFSPFRWILQNEVSSPDSSTREYPFVDQTSYTPGVLYHFKLTSFNCGYGVIAPLKPTGTPVLRKGG